jgi:hypothetical protein
VEVSKDRHTGLCVRLTNKQCDVIIFYLLSCLQTPPCGKCRPGNTATFTPCARRFSLRCAVDSIFLDKVDLLSLKHMLDLRRNESAGPVDIINFARRLRTVLVAGADTIDEETVPQLQAR